MMIRSLFILIVSALAVAVFNLSDDRIIARADLSSPPADEKEWKTELIDYTSYQGPGGCQQGYDWPTVAIDSQGRVHTTYIRCEGFTSWYAVKSGNTWVKEQVEIGGALALDRSGRPHRSYFSSTLRYAYKTAAGWQARTVDSTISNAYPISLVLDATDVPNISYCGDGHLKYARLGSSGWQVETLDGGNNACIYTSLALDSSNRPHIAYYDAATGDLKYVTKSAAGWQPETVDSQGDVGKYCSLAVDSLGRPHISYLDDTNDDLKYAMRLGPQWQIETVQSGGNVGYYSSLVLDAEDWPHIAYQGGGPLYAVKDNLGWNIQDVPVPGSGNWGIEIALAMDRTGYAHVIYGGQSYGWHLYYAHQFSRALTYLPLVIR